MEELKFDIDLQSILRVLMKYWTVLLICAILGALTGWSLSKWVIKPVYASSVTIYAWDNNDNPTTPTAKYQDIALNSQLVNDFREIITSYLVQDTVFTELKAKLPALQRSEFEIEASLQRNTRIIKIIATASTPEIAQMAANTSAAVFDKVVQDVMRLKNIKVIDSARLSLNALKPKTATNTVCGFFIGFVLALLAFLVSELLDYTIKSPDEIPLRLGKNVICTIPQAEKKDGTKDNSEARRICFFSDGHWGSAVSEAFKILRTNIEFTVPGKKQARIMMFTSALPGEGKSTIITNLAISICESGKKVLLIDCDLRKPFLHKFLSVDNFKGLVSVLAGSCTIQEVVHKNIINANLDLISSGPIPPNPTELLMTSSFKQLLAELSNDYEYIFIDAPPTLNMADSTIIGHLADATIFVITAGKTRIDLIKRSIRQMHQTKIEVAGILLNRFCPKMGKFDYFHYSYRDDSGISE